MYGCTLSSTLALEGVGVQGLSPAALPPGKTPYPFVQEPVWAPGDGLDGCGKSRFPAPGFDPRIVQRVVSRCTD
jgi:hypothetical protein